MSAQPNHAMSPGQELVRLVFLSPDRALAQRVITRLRSLGKIQWQCDDHEEPLVGQLDADVVLLDFSPGMTDRATQCVHDLALVAPHTAVLAIGSTASDGSAGILSALRAGVSDFIDLDAPDIHEARQAIERARTQVQPKPAHVVTAPQKHGHSILVLGVRPGVGASTLTAHLGVMIQQQLDQTKGDKHQQTNHALVLDMGCPGGDLALYLNTQDDFQVSDAVDNAFRFDNTLARTALARHDSNLAVLSRSLDTEVPSDASGPLDLLLDRLNNLFNVVLIDGGGIPTSVLSAALVNQASEIWLVVDQGIAAMVSLDHVLKTLRHCGVNHDKLGVVVNRHVSDSGLTPQQIAERFKLPLLATLPERGARLRACTNTGSLLLDTAPRDRYLQALRPLLKRLSPDTTPATKTRSSWLTHVRRRLGV